MTPPDPHEPRAWWEGRAYALILVVLSAVPFLWPPLPPLVDLPGHVGRWRVQLDIGQSADLARYFAFKWGILANLGVDILVEPLGRLIGLEPAVKLIVMAIPPITVAGLIGIAREAHGRVPATAAFALPLAWGYPFQFGFVNFALSMGLALCAFALWLRMGRLGRTRLRAGIFLALSILIWFAHVFGWGVLGLLVFSAELVRRLRAPARRWLTPVMAGLACWPLWPPLALMVAWRGQAAGVTTDWFFWRVKIYWLVSIFRERWYGWDVACVVVVLTVLVVGLFEKRFSRNPVLALAAAILCATFLILPRILLGSAYADMRLTPMAVAIALLALAPLHMDFRARQAFAIAATLFFVTRVAVSTAALAAFDAGWQAQLPALDHVRLGARVLALASIPCQRAWHTSRMEHLSSFATIRRNAFVNDQWVMPGAQLLSIRYGGGGRFTQDPSQIVRPTRRCKGRYENLLGPALATFPRDGFDYVWLIDLPPSQRPVEFPELVPLWFGAKTGALYRIDPSRQRKTQSLFSRNTMTGVTNR